MTKTKTSTPTPFWVRFIIGFIIVLALTAIVYSLYYVINKNNAIKNMKTVTRNEANADGCKDANEYSNCVVDDMINKYGYITANNVIVNGNTTNSDAVKRMLALTTACSHQYCGNPT